MGRSSLGGPMSPCVLQGPTRCPSFFVARLDSRAFPPTPLRFAPPNANGSAPPPAMDAEGAAAAKLRGLDAELAAKSSRVEELEARVSFLEAENARLREALACLAAGGEDPESGGRLAAGFLVRGSKRDSAEKPPGGSVAACGVIEISDDEEEGVNVNVSSKGRSPKEEGVVADPTPWKRAVTGWSEDEEDVAEGGGGSSSRGNSVGVGLEDDDALVSLSPRGRKRAAARLVTSDSEDEDGNDGNHGVDDQEEGGKPSKKRGIRGISDSDDEDATDGVDVVTSKAKAASPVQIEIVDDEDDMIPVCQVLKKMRKERANHDKDDDNGLSEVKGCSTPPTRRSARLVKTQSKGGRAARQILNFVEPKECEGSEDDIEEDDDMDNFINDEDSSENSVESAEESCDEAQASGTSLLNEESSTGPEESDGVVDYADVMACIGRKNKDKDWKFQGDMLAAFNRHPELCLKAVCALYRRQTEEEQIHKATIVHNEQGFSQVHAKRASLIAEFLLDGDLYGPVKKTISDLEEYDRSALNFCRKMASIYSKQLFAIYEGKEDPYFHP